MRTDDGLEATFQLGEVTASGDRLVFQGTVRMELRMPRQDERLPYEVEQAVEDAGQRFKRWVFCQMMEKLDAELVLASRQGKGGQGVVCRGRRSMTFKTVFGTVRVRRRRVQEKANGTLEIPSAKAWGTPQQVTITQGLQDAVCDAMVQESSRKSLRHVEERAGEPGLLARVTVLNLVHEEGGMLREAARRRAEAVFAVDAQAARCLLPSPRESPPDEEASSSALSEVAESGFEPLQGFPGAPGAEAIDLEQPRRVDPDTAMVRTATRSWCFAEENAQAVIYLVGALLAVLGVHQGRRRLLFVNDGARWIRDWFESLPVKPKTMVLCWYHLAKRTLSCLYMTCHGRKHREAVYAEVMSHLWEGRVDEALATLARDREEMKCRVALTGWYRSGARGLGWTGRERECWLWRSWSRPAATVNCPPGVVRGSSPSGLTTPCRPMPLDPKTAHRLMTGYSLFRHPLTRRYRNDITAIYGGGFSHGRKCNEPGKRDLCA